LAEQELKARLQFEELLRKFKSSLPRQWAKRRHSSPVPTNEARVLADRSGVWFLS